MSKGIISTRPSLHQATTGNHTILAFHFKHLVLTAVTPKTLATFAMTLNSQDKSWSDAEDWAEMSNLPT